MQPGIERAMSETSSGFARATAAMAEAEAVATLHRLNEDYIRAFAESDTVWYGEYLSDEFVCTLADGRRIGKTEFLEARAKRLALTDVTCDEIDVRSLGELALVQGVIPLHPRRRARFDPLHQRLAVSRRPLASSCGTAHTCLKHRIRGEALAVIRGGSSEP
jgi:hypothetical protein